MKIAIVTIGAPGSGKSTYARKLQESDSRYVILERDIMREEVCNEEGIIPESYNSESDNFHTMYYNIDEGIRDNIEKLVSLNVQEKIQEHDYIILSNTNLTEKNRSAQHNNLINNKFTVIYKVFNPNIYDLLYQNSIRKNIVNENVVFDMYLKLQHSKEHLLNFDNLEFVIDHETHEQSFHDSNERTCIICDLDGTIAHVKKDKSGNNSRSHFNMSKVHEDEFDDIIFSMVLALHRRYDSDIIFLTGRSADCFTRTIEWLDYYLGPFGMSFQKGDYQLYSRNNHDYSKDFKIKRELFNTFIKDKYEVLAVFDDRPVCVDLWNDLGLKTIAVADQRNRF